MLTAFISHPVCARHEMHEDHPESPLRLGAINDQILSAHLHAYLREIDAPLATDEQLGRAHDPAYVARIHQVAPQQGLVALDGDTAMNPYTLEAAQRAAGAAVHAVDLVCSGDMHHAFCAVRPPGHHAEYARAMGFCVFNNVAVGARHALAAHGMERVAILDFDVHHGNGTEDIFRDDPRVLFCSSFQHPFYPYSDPVSDRDHIIKSPLSAGAGSEPFRAAVRDQWLPALESFAPQLILFSAGFDAHREDFLGQLRLTEADYEWVTREVAALSDRHCPGRIVSCLEGGYSLSALGRSVVSHLRALAGV